MYVYLCVQVLINIFICIFMVLFFFSDTHSNKISSNTRILGFFFIDQIQETFNGSLQYIVFVNVPNTRFYSFSYWFEWDFLILFFNQVLLYLTPKKFSYQNFFSYYLFMKFPCHSFKWNVSMTHSFVFFIVTITVFLSLEFPM